MKIYIYNGGKRMTCDSCIHSGMCANRNKIVQIDEHTWDEYELVDEVEKFCPHFKEEVKHTKLRIEIMTDCFKNQELAKEKGWYRKFLYCSNCGLNVRTETWDDHRMFGMGTVLKSNEMPKYCPDCGQALDWSDTE